MPSAHAGPSADAVRKRLRERLAPVVESAGFDLEDLTVAIVGRRNLVRVVVDADGGVDLDAVAELSRALSGVLDRDAERGPGFAGPYVLEVTSPGVDRPLTHERHWRRAVGRLVQVSVAGAAQTGRVQSVDERGVTLKIGDSARHVPWTQLGRGKVQVEFNRPPTAGIDEQEG